MERREIIRNELYEISKFYRYSYQLKIKCMRQILNGNQREHHQNKI